MDAWIAWLGADTLRAVAAEWGPRLLAATLLALAGWALARGLGRLFDRLFAQVELDRTARVFVATVARFTVGVVTALAVLDQLGVDTTSILTSLGVMGLTLGFAAQNTLSNVISGLFIFWDRPFVIGDLVEIDDVYGRVETITLRSTRLVTPDGRMVALPNTMVANGRVISYTNFPHLRIEVEVTVSPETDLAHARRVLLQTLADDPDYMDKPAPDVVVSALNDDSVSLRLRGWLRDEKIHLPKRFALREAVFVALTEAGIEMPYDTVQLRPLTIQAAAGSP